MRKFMNSGVIRLPQVNGLATRPELVGYLAEFSRDYAHKGQSAAGAGFPTQSFKSWPRAL